MSIFTTMARGTAVGALMIGLLGVPAAARAAQYPGANEDPSGYTATVRIHFHGRGVPGGAAYVDVQVHPSCWWSEAGTDAKAMLAWYDQITGGATDNLTISLYGPRQVWVDAAAQEAAGTDLTWYKAYCKDPADYTKFGINGTDNGVDPGTGGVTWVTFLYRPFAAGAPVPAPRVSPEELARVAREQMVIPKPEADYNPKVNSPGAPTLVGLPTWFWVTNPLSVGGPAAGGAVGAYGIGTLDVTAELEQPDGLVWATVLAKTGGLTIHSAWGGSECSPERALIKYIGAANANACTVVFTHAAANLPVTTSTAWDATWTGSGGTGGALAGLNQDFTAPVSVAEVQNVVSR